MAEGNENTEKVSEASDTTENNSENTTEDKEQTQDTSDENEETSGKGDDSEAEDTDENTEETDLKNIDSSDKAAEILNTKGFKYEDLQKEFDEHGDITPETREKLKAAGFDKDIVDNFIEGQKARFEVAREAIKNELSESVGGRETYDKIIDWAAKNLSKEDIASINEVRDKNIMRIILKDLKNSMEDKEGKTPDYTKGTMGGSAEDVYESQAQMFEAIRNPKYRTDEAYRAKVMKKIQASREAGKNLGI
jgi:hypothetical protein